MDQFQFVKWVQTREHHDPDDSFELAHFPLPREMGDDVILLHHLDHQVQGILQSEEVGKCCFFPGHARAALNAPNFWPPGWFELWDLCDKWITHHATTNGHSTIERGLLSMSRAQILQRNAKSAKTRKESGIGIFSKEVQSAAGKKTQQRRKELGIPAFPPETRLTPMRITNLETGESWEFPSQFEAVKSGPLTANQIRRARKDSEGVLHHRWKSLHKKFKVEDI